jgi:AcrR family transcriptional regulator
MARPTNPHLRCRLRDQAVDYVLTHGIADLTLRPLAKALKTNARMLVYHFGSREGLMQEILAGLREREDANIQAWFASGKNPRTMSEFLRWYWGRLSTTNARPAARLIFELNALALRNPQDYPGVLEAPLAYWKRLTSKAGLRSKVRRSEATLLLAVTRGLLLDYCATGDRARTKAAMELVARMFESRKSAF